MLVVPDHHTPLRLRTHVDWPVPFVFGGGSGGSAATPAAASPAGSAGAAPGGFCERSAALTGRAFGSGADLMDAFLAEMGAG